MLILLLLFNISTHAGPPHLGEAEGRAERCEMQLRPQPSEDGLYTIVTVRGVPLSGEGWYPVEDVRARLNLSSDYREFEGATVLSVGEGFGNLLPDAARRGVDIYGVDPAYPRDGQAVADWERGLPATRDHPAEVDLTDLRTMVQEFGARLRHGAGEALPFADKSFDIVVSHRVLNNPETAELRYRFVTEAVRVARRQVRIDALSEMDGHEIGTKIQQEFPKVLSWRQDIVRLPSRRFPGTEEVSRLLILDLTHR